MLLDLKCRRFHQMECMLLREAELQRIHPFRDGDVSTINAPTATWKDLRYYSHHCNNSHLWYILHHFPHKYLSVEYYFPQRKGTKVTGKPVSKLSFNVRCSRTHNTLASHFTTSLTTTKFGVLRVANRAYRGTTLCWRKRGHRLFHADKLVQNMRKIRRVQVSIYLYFNLP